MKKIPTLFKREFLEDHKIITYNEVTPGMEWVLEGEGVATVKIDGACCAFINGDFYKRFDAKPGRKIPEGAIPCCDPDKITGHWPHWVKVDENNPSDKHFLGALRYAISNNSAPVQDAIVRSLRENTVITFEAVGLHFNSNPYGIDYDTLIPHGIKLADYCERSFEGINNYLTDHIVEGIVFWKDGEPQCKIRRKDFGIEWPIKVERDGK